MNALAPGWYPDPTGRHEVRWWTGAAWGDQVADHGQSNIDGVQSSPPLGASPQSSASPQVGAPAAAVGWGTIVGSAVAGLSVVLNWIDAPDSPAANAFDLPVAFLADYTTDASDSFNVGLVILVLAVAALASAFIRQPAWRVVGRVTGGALVAVGVAFVLQLYRLADEVGVSLSDVLGIAPFATIAGGVAVLIARGR